MVRPSTHSLSTWTLLGCRQALFIAAFGIVACVSFFSWVPELLKQGRKSLKTESSSFFPYALKGGSLIIWQGAEHLRFYG